MEWLGSRPQDMYIGSCQTVQHLYIWRFHYSCSRVASPPLRVSEVKNADEAHDG